MARPQQVLTIRPGLLRPLAPPSENQMKTVLRDFDIRADRFLLYPADPEPDSGHDMLLVAMGMFVARRPGSDLMLVCATQEQERTAVLAETAARMRMGERVRVAKVSENQIAVLMASCRAIVYPSLRDGFSPWLQHAIAFGKPLLCSKLSAFEEMTGDAANYFDPRRPDSIVDAIQLLDSDDQSSGELRAPAPTHSIDLNGDATIEAYLRVFQEVVRARR
jgi:glycosyltransferase involved in cell wall biosynthesis